MRVTTGRAFLEVLQDAGLLPWNCRRVIIDADVEGSLKIVYECFGSEELAEPVLVEDAFRDWVNAGGKAVDVAKDDAESA